MQLLYGSILHGNNDELIIHTGDWPLILSKNDGAHCRSIKVKWFFSKMTKDHYRLGPTTLINSQAQNTTNNGI